MRTTTRPTASNTTAIQSARSAPSSGAESPARVSSITLPSRRRCCPITSVVLRRSRRTGVLSCRCAALSRQHAPATSSPAGRTVSAFTK